MAKKPAVVNDEREEEDDEPSAELSAAGKKKVLSRKSNIANSAGVHDQLLDIFNAVEQGFRDQSHRSNDQLDFWDIYNCNLTSQQFYSGTSQIFVPIVHNAVNARKTRYVNQIFPRSGRHIEVTSSDDTQPDAVTALLEHYIRRAKLRTKVMPALMVNGDVEGQYNLYVSWSETKRNVVWRDEEQPKFEDTDEPNTVAEPVLNILEAEIKEGFPLVEVIADADLLVLPQTADSLEEAIASGGSVSLIRRWGKGDVRRMMREGWITKAAGRELLAGIASMSSMKPEDVNKAAKMVDAAGIMRPDINGPTYAQIYETFSMVEIGDDWRLCRAFYGGEQRILGAQRNPLWSDKLPILSAPVNKIQGAFKGISMIKPCATIQYAANDAVNEAWDSAAYALMPIIMTDPLKNPRIGSMVLSLAAVWECDPQSTQFAEFPQLWQHGFEMVSACKAEVQQTLSVSPAAIAQGQQGRLGGAKPTQAEVAQSQQVDILTTADAVTIVEESILTPLLALFLEFDHQYRDRELTVRSYGQMGQKANMQEIPPVQMDKRYVFTWSGVEQAKNAQQIQQQIAMMNVLRGIPPEQMKGYQINLVPVIQNAVESAFGPQIAPLVFVSPADQAPVPVMEENQLLSAGFDVPVHPMDDDLQHIQAHMLLLQPQQGATGGTPNKKKIQQHIMLHVQQKAQKEQAALQAQQQAVMGAAGGPPGAPALGAPPGGQPGMGPGAPGVPGGAGPGVAGTPRQGAMPGQATGGQGPPGMIHHDQLSDPSVMPRMKVA